ncbi:hypothetical protein NAPIS_ORF01617 [Vairimorpha apis BRL 01]|uniref:Uncharacterized protein n=1 Tax=Vairimorpha apis BRL 01 TaxID=1037528 RepID=T0KZX4_9MICR|nr:hypothetical protein NAPIS_ORF01617 [Vairimorpha apis BRL 01]
MLFFKFQHINKNNLKENFNTFSLEDIRRWYNNLSFVEFSEKPEQNQVVDEDVINENSEQNEDKDLSNKDSEQNLVIDKDTVNENSEQNEDKDLSNENSDQNLVIDKDTVNENSEQNEDKDLSNENSDQNLVLDKDTVNENLDNNEAIDKDIMMDYYFELVNPIKRKIDDIIEYEKWFKFEEHKKFYEGIKFLRNDKSITSNELCDNLNNLKISNNLSVSRYKKRALLHEKYKKRKTEDFYTNSKIQNIHHSY